MNPKRMGRCDYCGKKMSLFNAKVHDDGTGPFFKLICKWCFDQLVTINNQEQNKK